MRPVVQNARTALGYHRRTAPGAKAVAACEGLTAVTVDNGILQGTAPTITLDLRSIGRYLTSYNPVS
jgi:hypothetical protein